VSPAELLREARSFLTRQGGIVPALWPRAAAILGRQALEAWVRAQWGAKPDAAEMSHCSMRSQLIGLTDVVDGPVVARANFVWAALSAACHYHPYELAPTSGELSHWLDEVDALIAG